MTLKTWLLVPAMSKKDMGELRSSMKDVTLKKEKVRRSSFTRIVRSRNNSFMDAQIQQAFEMVDKDHSGTIDRDEFEKWIGNGGANRLAELAKNIQAVESLPLLAHQKNFGLF